MSALGLSQSLLLEGQAGREGEQGTRGQRPGRPSERGVTRAKWGVNAGGLVTAPYNQLSLTCLQHLSSFLADGTVWSTTGRKMLSS